MNYFEQILPFNENLKYRFNEKYSLIQEWVNTGIKYVRVVLDEENDKIIHFSGTTNNSSNIINPTFQDLFEMIITFNENNLSILKTLYNRVEPDLILTIINKPLNCKERYLGELLKESNGYLIYAHQLERFTRKYLNLTESESVELRRDWNKKSIKKREVLIQSDFYYFIESRMPQYFVFQKES
jgi:hypothetical protein